MHLLRSVNEQDDKDDEDGEEEDDMFDLPNMSDARDISDFRNISDSRNKLANLDFSCLYRGQHQAQLGTTFRDQDSTLAAGLVRAPLKEIYRI